MLEYVRPFALLSFAADFHKKTVWGLAADERHHSLASTSQPIRNNLLQWKSSSQNVLISLEQIRMIDAVVEDHSWLGLVLSSLAADGM